MKSIKQPTLAPCTQCVVSKMQLFDGSLPARTTAYHSRAETTLRSRRKITVLKHHEFGLLNLHVVLELLN